MKFVPSEFNVEVNIWSRWKVVAGDDLFDAQEVLMNDSEVDSEVVLEVNVNEIPSDSEEVIGKQLHGGHVGMKVVIYRSQIWNLPLCMNKLVLKLGQCAICEKHKICRRRLPRNIE